MQKFKSTHKCSVENCALLITPNSLIQWKCVCSIEVKPHTDLNNNLTATDLGFVGVWA